ncbi:MAG: hypothetical protein IJR33_00945 [Clostridia bacterium]|nr:hypothetical protein [Clostridia bacterium]
MKKKLFTVAMICVLVAGLTACSQKTSNQQSDNTGKTPVATSTGKEFREGFSIRSTKTALKHKASGGFFGFIRGICF